MLGLKGKYMRLCKSLVSGDKCLKIQKENKILKTKYVSLHDKDTILILLSTANDMYFFFLKATSQSTIR